MAEGTNRWLGRLLYMQAALRASATENLKCKIDFFYLMPQRSRYSIIIHSGIRVRDLKENGIIFLIHIAVANGIYVMLCN